MPINIPERKVAPPRQGRAVRMTAYPAPAQRVGIEIERIGRVLSSFGGDWGKLAIKSENLRAHNETLSADNEYEEKFNEWYNEDLSKDKDYEGRLGRFLNWHDEETRRIIGEVKNQSAQNDIRNKFKEYKNTKGAKIYLESKALATKENKALLDIWLIERVKEWALATPKRREEIEGSIHKKLKELDEDDLLMPGEIETRLYNFKEDAKKKGFQEAVRGVRGQLLGVLRLQGEEVAVNMIMNKKNFPELEAMEYEKGDADEARFNLSKEISRIAVAYQDEFDREQAERRKDTVDTITEKLSKGESPENADIENIEGDEKLKKEIKEIQEAPTKKGRKPEKDVETDWSKKIELQDDILKFLLGMPKIEGGRVAMTEEELKVKLMRSYQKDQSIKREDFNSLLELTKMEWAKDRSDYIGFLKQGWDVIRDTGFKGWPWGKAESEAVAISKARIMLLQWMQAEIARKKDLDLERVLSRAKELLISAKKGYPKVPGKDIYKMPPKPKEAADIDLWYRILGKWPEFSPKMQEQIWIDIEAGMTWEQIINKDYEE